MDADLEESQVRPSESEPNPTQERIGEGESVPADVSWDEESFGETPDTEGDPEAQEEEGFKSL